MTQLLEKTQKIHPILWLAGGILLAYIATRAWSLGFTHDESLTYTIVRGNPTWAGTANNHVLNTWFTKASSWLFGYDEWALRLPNVLAFLAYFFFWAKITERLRLPWRCLAGAFLLLNPFALDFFSLCRGYGLAMAFGMGNLYFWIKALERKEVGWVAAALASGVLAVYSNYSFTTFFVAVQAAGLLAFYLSGKFSTWKIMLPLLAVTAAALVPALLHILKLSGKNEFYYGVSNIIETWNSLVFKSLYTVPVAKNGWVVLISTGIILVSFAAGIYFFIREKSLAAFRFLWLVFAFSMLLPIALHYGMGFIYPIERYAIFLILVNGLYLPYLLQTAFKNISPKLNLAAAALLFLIVAVPFIRGINFHYSITWKEDSDTKAAVLLLAKEADGAPTRLGVSPQFEPAVNYYRERLGLNWLEKATREPIIPGGSDYFYCFQRQVEALQPVKIIHCFEVTESCLVKNEK